MRRDDAFDSSARAPVGDDCGRGGRTAELNVTVDLRDGHHEDDRDDQQDERQRAPRWKLGCDTAAKHGEHHLHRVAPHLPFASDQAEEVQEGDRVDGGSRRPPQ